MKIFNPDSTKIPHVAKGIPSEPNQWVTAHYDPNSRKQKVIRNWFREALIAFESEPIPVQQAWDDFYQTDKGRLPSSGIGYATLYIYCKKRELETYFINQWSQEINYTWSQAENHIRHFFENQDAYLYYRTWEKLNEALHKNLVNETIIPNGCVSGTVFLVGKHEDDEPIQDALVQVFLEETIITETNSLSDGTYDIPNLKPDTYKLTFMHPEAIDPLIIQGNIITALNSTVVNAYLLA